MTVKVCVLKVVQACSVGAWRCFEAVHPPAYALTPISSWPRNFRSKTRHVCWVISGEGVGDTDFQERVQLCNQRAVNDCHVVSLMSSLPPPIHISITAAVSGVPGEGLGGFRNPPPQKFRRPSKIVPNSTRLWKLLKIVEFRTPTPQDARKKGSKILKLPSVRNCFTLAMTNKLVFIINSLKVPKIKKILLYQMKFLVPNYSCLQNPWLGGYRPQIPVLFVLCPQLNLLNPHPEQNSWVRHWLQCCATRTVSWTKWTSPLFWKWWLSCIVTVLPRQPGALWRQTVLVCRMVRHLLEGAGDKAVAVTSVTLSVLFVQIVTDIVTTNALTSADV